MRRRGFHYAAPDDPRRSPEERYADEVGDQALERQVREREERHPCCGERLEGGHHFMCSKRPADEPPAHVEGQQGLL